MFQLTPDLVLLGAQPRTRSEAIHVAGNLLVSAGYIHPDYIQSMLRREEVADTYLGHGIAIPHGLPEDRDWVLRTGIAVVQVPEGVPWREDARAQVVVAIAARSDEHLQVLRRLTRLMQDAAHIQRLITTSDKDEIVRALNGEPPAEAAATPAVSAPGEVAVVLRNRHGLHARPATVFVRLAKQFQAAVRVRHGERVADGKSLLSLLQLGADCGTTLYLSAEGPDAPVALQTLSAAIAAGLEDEVVS